jgi:signal transduction histidine kinase
MRAPEILAGFENGAEAFEDLAAEMSAAFVRITIDQIDDEIQKWLQHLVMVLGIDRCTVGQLDSSDGLLYTSYQWSREGIAPNPARLNVKEVLPWLAGKIMAGELVVLSNVEELPPEAGRDGEFAAHNGTKSNVTVPLRVEDVTIGAVAFDSVRRPYAWSDRTVQRCCLVAEIIGSALERKRAGAEIRRLRNQVREAAAVVMVEEATAALAHQLNQPLGAILSNAQAARHLLAESVPDLAEIKVVLDDIISDNARAVETIRAVRAHFQRSQLKVSLFDPSQLLIDVERIILPDARNRDIDLRVEAPMALPPVLGDRSQLIQAVINLVENAFDATTDAAAGPSVVVVDASEREADRVHIAVRDSGSGIDSRIMPRLFEAFVTTKPEGMGLGLAIARSIIEAHGGRLWATRNPDRGTTMEFYLPTEAARLSER